jgi:hypothetical protein
VGRMKLQQTYVYVVRQSPCTQRFHGALVGGILCVYIGSLVESLNAMTVAEIILGPHHTLELARGHSRMQVWSSATIDGRTFAGDPGAVPQSICLPHRYMIHNQGNSSTVFELEAIQDNEFCHLAPRRYKYGPFVFMCVGLNCFSTLLIAFESRSCGNVRKGLS